MLNTGAILSMVNAMRNQAISLVQQAEAIVQLIEPGTTERPTCTDCGSMRLQEHALMGGGIPAVICGDCGKEQQPHGS